MKIKIFTAVALLCCFIMCFAAIAKLSGKWTGSVKMPDGNVYAVTYIFDATGDKLTGAAQAEGKSKTIMDGKIHGDDFSFSIKDDDGATIPHAGKYYLKGDSIVLTIDYANDKLHAVLKRENK